MRAHSFKLFSNIFLYLTVIVFISIAARAQCPDDMVFVPAGEFIMGSNDAEIEGAMSECVAAWGNACEKESFLAETPARRVTLDDFCIDKTEVTQAAYEAVMGENPSFFKECGPDCPVGNVVWDDAAAYCEKVGKKLPTEAQWEKAARGAGGLLYSWGNQAATCELAAMDETGSPGCGREGPWPAGSFPGGTSPYGALDMAGNALEWTRDCFTPDRYTRMPPENPLDESPGCARRTLRGGAWNFPAWMLRAAYRTGAAPGDADSLTGFRCATDTAAVEYESETPGYRVVKYTFEELCDKLVNAALDMGAGNDPMAMKHDCLAAEATLTMSLGSSAALQAYLKHLLGACAGRNGEDWYACYTAELPAATAAVDAAAESGASAPPVYTFEMLCDRLVASALAMQGGGGEQRIKNDCMAQEAEIRSWFDSETQYNEYLQDVLTSCAGVRGEAWYQCYVNHEYKSDTAEDASHPEGDTLDALCDRFVRAAEAEAGVVFDDQALAMARDSCIQAQYQLLSAGADPERVRAHVTNILSACHAFKAGQWIACFEKMTSLPETE